MRGWELAVEWGEREGETGGWGKEREGRGGEGRDTSAVLAEVVMRRRAHGGVVVVGHGRWVGDVW